MYSLFFVFENIVLFQLINSLVHCFFKDYFQVTAYFNSFSVFVVYYEFNLMLILRFRYILRDNIDYAMVAAFQKSNTIDIC